MGLYRCHVVAIWGASWVILESMGVKLWEMPHGLEVEGHKVWVRPRGLEVEGQNMCVLPHRLGGLADQKSKAPWGPQASGSCFWSLRGRGVNNLWLIGLRLRIYG